MHTQSASDAGHCHILLATSHKQILHLALSGFQSWACLHGDFLSPIQFTLQHHIITKKFNENCMVLKA